MDSRSAIFACIGCLNLWSLPQNPELLSGNASFDLTSENVLEIPTSGQTIIEWKEFSIDVLETVRFLQSNENGCVLNRVLEAYPSRLAGRLESNGLVLLINPYGILIGKEAQVETGSFIASTLDLHNELFISSGEMSFKGDSLASVINEGVIHAKNGDICLIGAHVENRGVIETAKGITGLFAHRDVILKPSGINRLFIKTTTDRCVNDNENFFAQAFIPDDDLAKVGYIVQSGSIISKGKENWVGFLGDVVDIVSGANIDVSSPNGGGTILLGGDYQGKSPFFPNASITNVASGATVCADATECGDGGKIIVWGDRGAKMAGSLSAQGGPLGGDGGFLEISSQGALDFTGKVSTIAPMGQVGLLYLDPTDIVINVFGGAGSTVPGPFIPAYCPAVNASVAVADVITALSASNVSIATNCANTGSGDITINGQLTFNTNIATTLTLLADRDIIVNAGVAFGAASNQRANFQANRNITVSAQLLNNSAVANGGSFALTAGANGGLGSITLNSPLLAAVQYNGAQAADLTLTANNGITLAAIGPGTAISSSRPGTIQLIDNSNVGITILRNISHSGANAAGIIGVSIQEMGNGPIQINQVGSVFVGASFATTQVNAPNADLIIRGAGNTASGQLGVNPGAAVQNFTGNINVCCRNLSLLAGGNNSATAGIGHGAFNGNGNAITIGAAITVNASQNILLQGGIGGGNSDARIGHGCVALQPTNRTQDGNITVTAGGRIDLFSGSGTESHAWIGHGSNSNGAVNAETTISGNITVAALGTFATPGTGNINLSTNAVGFRAHARIGHNLRDRVVSFIGDINVSAAGDLNVLCNGSHRAYIGHFSSDNSLFTGSIQGNYLIRAASNLTLGAPAGFSAFIGYKRTSAVVIADPPFIGQLETVVGNDLTLITAGIGGEALPFVTLGIYVQNNAGAVPVGTTANVYIGVNNDLIITNNNPNTRIGIESPNNLFLAVNRNIVGSDAPRGIAGIGTTNQGTGTTFIRCRGNIDARSVQIGTGLGLLNLGFPIIAPNMRSVDVRAGGDIVLGIEFSATPGVGFSTVSGSTLFQADSPFNAGDFWTFAAGSLTSIAGSVAPPFQTLPLNFTFPTFCPAATTAILPAPFQTFSPNGAILANGTGAVSINTILSRTLVGGAANVTLQSVSGPITIRSADTFAAGGNANLTLGTLANQLSIITASGNIEISGSTPDDSFHDITVLNVANPWTSGSIFISANNNLNVLTVPIVTSGASPITLIADNDQSGAGDVNLSQNISSAGGAILLDAGFGAAAGASSINQTAGTVSTIGGGSITYEALNNINLAGNAFASAVDGPIEMVAGNDITINGAPTTIQTIGGNISIRSDSNNNSSGNINLNSNVTSTNGNIFLQAGAANPCSGAFSFSSINQTAGTVSTATGSIQARAESDINLSSPVSFSAPAGSISTQAGHDTLLTNTVITAGGLEILMISGHDISFINSSLDAPLSIVTLVVDQCFPAAPLIGSGAFNLDATSFIVNNNNLRIFTALQSQNTILGLLNGNLFIPGTLYANTASEHWCQYFSLPFPYPFFGTLGIPFTLFYKDCLQQAMNQAQIIVSSFLVDLHPFNEYPGWMEKFYLKYHPGLRNLRNLNPLPDESYYFRRRNSNILNHPKAWTILLTP